MKVLKNKFRSKFKNLRKSKRSKEPSEKEEDRPSVGGGDEAQPEQEANLNFAMNNLEEEESVDGLDLGKVSVGRERKINYFDSAAHKKTHLHSLKGIIDKKGLQQLELEGPVDASNYGNRYDSLVWMEQAHQIEELEAYETFDVQLERTTKPNLYKLKVEASCTTSRPLMEHDEMTLCYANGRKIKGYIRHVQDDYIIGEFSEWSKLQPRKEIASVSFAPNSLIFKRWHQGVKEFVKMSKFQQIAFPKFLSDSEMKEPLINIPVKYGSFFNRGLNRYQRKAVVNILRATCRPAPYIMFGPPGTGKTVALVEAALQIYNLKPDAKILICGGSNSSVDRIVRVLMQKGEPYLSNLCRIVAKYRLMEELVTEDLLSITRSLDRIEDGQFELDFEEYRNFRIIAITCNSAAKLVTRPYSDVKFDYIFIDEAGYSSEPDTIISLTLLKNESCLVLAGDPYQLGPITSCELAKDRGLSLSFLERLFRFEAYQRQNQNNGFMIYDERYLTKLNINYRCDGRLMQINNELFYEDELEFKQQPRYKLLKQLELKGPMVFHHVHGRQKRHDKETSWFNLKEAQKCLACVRGLYNCGIRSEQIGIITPYRAQVELLQKLFACSRTWPCMVGTVEKFQGDERDIMIISTVRSTKSYDRFGFAVPLTFLNNEKRFNVSTSRAKWLCILIGDREILNTSEHWSRVVENSETEYKFNTKTSPKKVANRL